MADYTEVKLSGSTSGRNIKVAATATPGTLIHATTANKTTKIELWACNTSASDVVLTIERGNVTSPDDLVEYTVPAEDGWYCVDPGLLLEGSLDVRAFAATANVINIAGQAVEIG